MAVRSLLDDPPHRGAHTDASLKEVWRRMRGSRGTELQVSMEVKLPFSAGPRSRSRPTAASRSSAAEPEAALGESAMAKMAREMREASTGR